MVLTPAEVGLRHFGDLKTQVLAFGLPLGPVDRGWGDHFVGDFGYSEGVGVVGFGGSLLGHSHVLPLDNKNKLYRIESQKIE